MPGKEEISTLVVIILKAQNLHNKSFFKQDVYATVTLNGRSLITQIKVNVKGSQHPLWDDELQFPVLKDAVKKHRELKVSCWAKEHKDDMLLGEAKVNMTPTVKSKEFDEWVPLSTGEAQQGDIYLEISYYSNAPVPKASLLAAPANLARWPSKLSPAERLH
ncbi:C2 domain-containing protein [Rhodocollybia butyracea]|uniref:C2 domain-containing protein n=1 Tax=Rhodocollybia butyracea TaxID=206335 RepID=A0A9P5P9J1_9AGAR|nr:C2 domain-containing protein [Rhodocollybia butyracea]